MSSYNSLPRYDKISAAREVAVIADLAAALRSERDDFHEFPDYYVPAAVALQFPNTDQGIASAKAFLFKKLKERDQIVMLEFAIRLSEIFALRGGIDLESIMQLEQYFLGEKAPAASGVEDTEQGKFG